MRITVFRRLLAEEFGPARAETLARDHVLSALGGLTIDQALAAGTEPRQAWIAICDAMEVPAARR